MSLFLCWGGAKYQSRCFGGSRRSMLFRSLINERCCIIYGWRGSWVCAPGYCYMAPMRGRNDANVVHKQAGYYRHRPADETPPWRIHWQVESSYKAQPESGKAAQRPTDKQWRYRRSTSRDTGNSTDAPLDGTRSRKR